MLFDCPVRRSSRVTLPSCDVRVDDVRILGIAARLESVAAADDVPVARADAPAVQRARRAAVRPVVLRAAADVVERLRVVDRHAVVLRDRQAREEPERRALVVGLVDAAVVADQDVIPIGRIELDDVVIDVHAGLFPVGLPPRLAAVRAAIEIGVHRPDRVGPMRIDEDLLVVRGAAAAIPVARRRAGAPVRVVLRLGAAGAACRCRRPPRPAFGTVRPMRVHDAPASSER